MDGWSGSITRRIDHPRPGARAIGDDHETGLMIFMSLLHWRGTGRAEPRSFSAAKKRGFWRLPGWCPGNARANHWRGVERYTWLP
jgi:hypothetical protein